ncbi:hypothetical protein VQ042_08860 [Aurantimonas sp. A2-1-M11]|uniref:hypothetical protein n=1 Tax=Aurantimonas sp. A2-1-M11 TaxID=3113712 RepID=UPI002F940850
MMSSKFDHPHHGSYEKPQDVLKDDRLSDGEKETVLTEWRASLQHILSNDPNAPEVKATSESLDTAIENLAAGRT